MHAKPAIGHGKLTRVPCICSGVERKRELSLGTIIDSTMRFV